MDFGRLFFALMYKDKDVLEKVIDELKTDFGGVVAKIPEYDFDFTDYYLEEFGSDLKKTIIVFEKNIEKKDLIEIKIISSHIEKDFSPDGNKRVINVDPGYLDDNQVVLASFKGKDFKEDIGEGIFSHIVLVFEDGRVRDFHHTFADFKSKPVQDFFLSLIK
jgi:hypothetical protein